MAHKFHFAFVALQIGSYIKYKNTLFERYFRQKTFNILQLFFWVYIKWIILF